MIIAIETKKTRMLGINYEQLIVLALLSFILPSPKEVAIKFLVKETFLKKKKIVKVIDELINLGLIVVRDNNLVMQIERYCLLGLKLNQLVAKTEKRKKQIENEIKDEINNLDMVPYTDIIALYHELCPNLPKVKFLTQKRLNFIRKRYKEFGLEGIKEVFKKVGQSSFLQGEKSKWRASFDWIMKRENFIKILEDYYVDENKNKMISL
jgi:hypothetical protein